MPTIQPVYGLPLAVAPRWDVYNAILQTPNLMEYWPMDDAVGSNAAKGHFAGKDAAVYGATVTFGVAGPAYPAGQKCASIANGGFSTGLAPTNQIQYSVEAWVNTTVTGKYLLGSRGGGLPGMNFGIRPYGAGGASGTMSLAFGYDGTDQGPYSKVVNDGVWHHLAGTFAGVSGSASTQAQFQLYVDGAKSITGTVAAGSITPPWTGTNIRFGADGDGYTSSFTGKMCHVAVYSRALTEAEIQRHYRAMVG